MKIKEFTKDTRPWDIAFIMEKTKCTKEQATKALKITSWMSTAAIKLIRNHPDRLK